MSLYGLDIIEDQDGKRYLAEINGIRSGMHGFSKVYGDDRVQKRVNRMLQEKHGKLTVNDGTFSARQFIKRHPLKFLYVYSLSRVPRLNKLLFPMPVVLHSPQAELDWLQEKPQNGKFPEHFDIYEKYDGKGNSAVIDLLNEQLPQSSVNSFVAEEIARNKFLQYILLRDSEIAESLIPSTFVGLGMTDKSKLIALLSNYQRFAVKPILGMQGSGVRFLDRDAASILYSHDEQEIQYFQESIWKKLIGRNGRPRYLEDMIEMNDFTFEWGISIFQPFLDSRRLNEEHYSSIRAIVCNKEFVDAYKRVSSDPKVNLSQDAEAEEFNYDSDFVRFCEKVIDVFEIKSVEQNSNSFKRDLYTKYMESIGRSIPRWKSDLEKNFLNAVLRIMVQYSQTQEQK